MSGFGRSPYGRSPYGTGVSISSGPVVVANLLVQSDTDSPGSQCVISGVGIPIVDTLRNDQLSGPALNVSKWLTASVGRVQTSFLDSVFNIKLVDTPTLASYVLSSTQTSVSADVSIDYNIVSDMNINPVTGTATFASLQYLVDSTKSFTISRRLVPGFNGHQIYVSRIENGVEVNRASLQTTDQFGTLRLVKHNGLLMAIYNGLIIYQDVSGFSDTGRIILSTSVTGHNMFVWSQLSNFTSDTGVLFGSTLLLERDIELVDKVNGIIPDSSQVGPVNCYAFNHNGLVGQQNGAFTYPLVTGVELSAQAGFISTVQGDPQLRD